MFNKISLFLFCFLIGHVSFGKPLFGTASRNPETHQFVPENVEFIQEIRSAFQKDPKNFRINFYDFLKPHAHHLLETIKKNPEEKNKEFIQILSQEISDNIERSSISPDWLMGAHFRYLSLLQDPSTEEKLIFAHIKDDFFNAFLKRNNKGVLPSFCVDLFTRITEDDIYLASYRRPLSEDIRDAVSEQLGSQMPLFLPLPLLNEDILPIEFLVQSWIDGIHPIGMPIVSKEHVHGYRVSPLGFAAHDRYHNSLDRRDNALLSYIYSELIKASGDVWISDIIPTVTSLAIQKYRLIINTFEGIFQAIKEDKKALVGLFFMVHEMPHFFSEKVFNFSHPTEILNEMPSVVTQFIMHDFSWDSPSDFLHTDPLTGCSTWTDDEIKDFVFKKLNEQCADFLKVYREKYLEKSDFVSIKDVDNVNGFLNFERTKTVFEDKTDVRIHIEKSSLFINATVESKKNGRKIYSFPTLLHKRNNCQSWEGLLQMADVKLELPSLVNKTDLNSFTANRRDTMVFLQERNAGIVDVVNYFIKEAKQYLETKGRGKKSRKTPQKEFEKSFKEIDEKMRGITQGLSHKKQVQKIKKTIP